MSKGVKYTQALFVVTILLIAVYDAGALLVWGAGATISRVIGVEASFDAPTIPFGVGCLIGHLFWPQKKSYRTKED